MSTGAQPGGAAPPTPGFTDKAKSLASDLAERPGHGPRRDRRAEGRGGGAGGGGRPPPRRCGGGRREGSPRRALSARCRIEGSSGLVHAPRARHRRALPGSRRLRAAPAGFRDRRLPGRRVRARSLPEEFGRKERGRGTVFLPRACTRPRRDVGEDGGRKESGRPIGPIGAGRGVRGRARRRVSPGRRNGVARAATPPPSGAGRPPRGRNLAAGGGSEVPDQGTTGRM